jgi:putative transposase
MSRANRIEYCNSFHHIITRGYNQKNIFLDKQDFNFLITQISSVHKSHGIIIHSYCLMNNHIHLLIQNPLKNLSKAMHLILTRYADYFKRKYSHPGKVFEKRFTSILVDTELYFNQLSKYIHNNPVGVIVKRPEDWHWSSYKYCINSRLEKPEFLEIELILKKIGGYRSLIQFTNEIDDWDPMDYIFSNTILGSENFIEEITNKHINPEINLELQGSLNLNKTYRFRIDEIRKIVSSTSFDLNTQASLLIYALRKRTNMTFKEISSSIFLGHLSVSALSCRYERIKAKAQRDKKIANILVKVQSW